MKRLFPILSFLIAVSALAQPSATVDKLVGTDSSTVCSSGSDAISVLPGTTVYYCYSFTNLTAAPADYIADDDHLGIVMNGTVGAFNSTTSVLSYLIGMNETTNLATWRGSFLKTTEFFNDTATVSVQFPLQVSKLIGTEPPPACGPGGEVIVGFGEPLYYCYQTINISNMTVQYDLVDDQLGTIASNRSLPAYSNDTLWANTTFPPGVRNLTNVATWTVAGMPGLSGTSPATAFALTDVPTASESMLILLGLALIVAAVAMIRLR